jgi:hypothetical protein
MQPAALLIARVLPIYIADVEHVRQLAEIRGCDIETNHDRARNRYDDFHVSFSCMVNTLDQSEIVPKLVSCHV